MKYSYTFILFWCCLAMANSQVTLLPDAAFEQKLVQLGIDTDGLVNGEMITTDASGVLRLDLSGTAANPANIQDLTGIEAFVDLDTLYCPYNQLTTLNLQSNIRLKALLCEHNQLMSLDISNNTLLNYLHCYGNNFSSLNFSSNNIALTHLECQDNPLQSIDLRLLTNLSVLNCSNTQLQALDISENRALVTLYCANNQLQELQTDQHPQLSYIDCQNNQLRQIDLYQNTVYSLDCSNNQLTTLDLANKSNISFVKCTNNQLQHLNLLGSGILNQLNCTNNPSNLSICVDNVAMATAKPLWQKPTRANYTSNCFPRAVIGRVSIDSNNNCTTDVGEIGLVGSLVTFQKGNQIYTVNTVDSLGNYVVNLDTGTYQVSVQPPSPYWNTCTTTQQVVIDTSYTLQTIHWSLQPLLQCPLLQVDIAAPLLRMTGQGTAYTVRYRNQGTQAALNAWVAVTLDADINVLSTSQPIISQQDQTYRFNLGTIAVGQQGSLQLQVLVDTSAIMGQTHCATAHIYPDSLCINELWTGARLSSEATCANNQITFKISNLGTSTTQTQQFSIFEDDIMMRTGGINLGGGQDTIIIIPAAAASTYRIQVQQANGYPNLLGDSVTTAVIEGCVPAPDGSFYTDFVTQFSNGNSSPFEAVDCQKNVGAFDPNDKAAQPMGYDAIFHYLHANVPLDYKIRFQNTGNDTAFNIVVIDTLSHHLDENSLQMGASSHAYTWSIQNHILTVYFNNIMLPDSNVNVALSNGFFRYNIRQKANNPEGTVIENTAHIYFDYNAPIVTNTTWHTIGGLDFIKLNVAVEQVYQSDVKILVAPNPMTQSTTLTVSGKAFEELQLVIYDALGSVVQQQQAAGRSTIVVHRNKLPAGIYYYTLSGNQQLLGSGKIMVQ